MRFWFPGTEYEIESLWRYPAMSDFIITPRNGGAAKFNVPVPPVCSMLEDEKYTVVDSK
jgi:hypothetical protein